MENYLVMKQEWERLLSEAQALGIPPEHVRKFILNQALSQQTNKQKNICHDAV